MGKVAAIQMTSGMSSRTISRPAAELLREARIWAPDIACLPRIFPSSD